ncbi:hypothetical protein ABIB73_001729 [Bradyrhizobium sp. F1.4.3]|uniref:hypothetical protein n=1 Tax=Bradyrhizobium sp. F1.4.3 TaxID=3156356 RepID=UPI003392350B
MSAVVFGLNSRQGATEYALSLPAEIERGCSIGANHAQIRPADRFASDEARDRRFRIIQAHLNKRSGQAFPRSNCCWTRHGAPLPI